MTYTAKQIENAKYGYKRMVRIHTLADYDVSAVGYNTANERMDFHNAIVTQILAGNKEVQNEWKKFFLTEEVKKDQKADESKAKKTANKEASADVLAPIKLQKRIVEFGKWLNTSGNPFRKEHFSKSYSEKSVNAFLSI